MQVFQQNYLSINDNTMDELTKSLEMEGLPEGGGGQTPNAH